MQTHFDSASNCNPDRAVKLIRLALDSGATEPEAIAAGAKGFAELRRRGISFQELAHALAREARIAAAPRPAMDALCMPFGKFEGQTLAKILAQAPDYLRWVRQNCATTAPNVVAWINRNLPVLPGEEHLKKPPVRHQ